MDYKGSRGDQGAVHVEMIKNGHPRGPTLSPGSYRLDLTGSGPLTSTSLQWGQRGVLAGGQSYTFRLDVSAVDRNGDGRASVSGKRVTFTLEMRPPGP